jgi:tryptophan 2,3-dioxygenase
MLEHISPRDYHVIRSALGHGSGFDSPGFNKLERVAQDTWKAFQDLLRERGISLLDLYTDPQADDEAYVVAELLTDWDERLGLWRLHHLKVVERVIGSEAVGTQGTPVSQLRELTTRRYFPELWAVRNEIAHALRRDPSDR